MAQPNPLRNRLPWKTPPIAVGGGVAGAAGAMIASDNLAEIDRKYGPEANREAAPGELGGNIAGGMAFGANPPAVLQSSTQRALGTPGMRAFANRAVQAPAGLANTPPAGSSVRLGGLRAAWQRGLGETAKQVVKRGVSGTVGGTLRRIPGAAATYGNVKGLADSWVDNSTGYANEYNRRMGFDSSPAAGIIGDVARPLQNMGNAVGSAVGVGGRLEQLGGAIGNNLASIQDATRGVDGFWNKAAAAAHAVVDPDRINSVIAESYRGKTGDTTMRGDYYAARRNEQARAAGKPGDTPKPATPELKFRNDSTPPDSMFRKTAAEAAAEAAAKRTAAAQDAAQAARYAAAPDVVQAAGAQDANKAEAAGIRSAGRVQDYSANARGTITGNALDGMRGDTAELMRRMENDLTSYKYKGFPGLRAARAEMWNNLINGANGVTAKGADNAAAADMQGMQDANVAQRAFSDRKNKVDMFNVDTSEDRRAGDLDRRQKLIESVLGGGVRRRGEDPQTYAEIAKGFGGDYTAAAQSVLRNKAAAGEGLTDDPLATMALTNLSDEVLAGNGRMARRGIGGTTFFGAGADGPVDPNPLNYTRQERGYFDRLGSALWPWGVNSSDYLYVDKAGNKRYRDTPLFSDDPVLDKQIRARIAAGTGYKE